MVRVAGILPEARGAIRDLIRQPVNFVAHRARVNLQGDEGTRTILVVVNPDQPVINHGRGAAPVSSLKGAQIAYPLFMAIQRQGRDRDRLRCRPRHINTIGIDCGTCQSNYDLNRYF